MDIDDTENPFDTGAVNPGYDETGEMNEMDRFPSSSSRRGSEDTTYHRTRGETSFIEGIDEHTPLITKETKRDEAWDRIKRKFPNINPANSSFTATLDEYDRVEVRLKRDRGKYHLLFNSDGEVNEKIPKTIKDALGTPAEDNSCGYTTPRLGVFPRLMISAWCRLGVPRVSDYPKRRGYTPNKLPKANKLKHFHLAGNG